MFLLSLSSNFRASAVYLCRNLSAKCTIGPKYQMKQTHEYYFGTAIPHSPRTSTLTPAGVGSGTGVCARTQTGTGSGTAAGTKIRTSNMRENSTSTEARTGTEADIDTDSGFDAQTSTGTGNIGENGSIVDAGTATTTGSQASSNISTNQDTRTSACNTISLGTRKCVDTNTDIGAGTVLQPNISNSDDRKKVDNATLYKKYPVGVQDFRVMTDPRENFFYIDKTKFIQKLYEYNAQVVFVLQARKFGKTINISTQAYFYNHQTAQEMESRFKELEVYKDNPIFFNEHFGKYPVILMNFTGFKAVSKEELMREFATAVQNCFAQHEYLKESPYLSTSDHEEIQQYLGLGIQFKNFTEAQMRCMIGDSVERLSYYIHKHFEGVLNSHKQHQQAGKQQQGFMQAGIDQEQTKLYQCPEYTRPMIFVDEYDSPITSNINNEELRNLCAQLMRDLYLESFKLNQYYSQGFIYGILRIEREEYFSSFNNGTYLGLDNELTNDMFAFNQNDVTRLIKNEVYYSSKYGHMDKQQQENFILQKIIDANRFYNGYYSYNNNNNSLYNPYSILNFCNNDFEMIDYWAQTSKNAKVILHNFVRKKHMRAFREFIFSRFLELQPEYVQLNYQTQKILNYHLDTKQLKHILVEKEHASQESESQYFQYMAEIAFCGFLAHSGYLTQAPITEKDRKNLKLKISNQEVLNIFSQTVNSVFNINIKSAQEIKIALQQNNIEDFIQCIQGLLYLYRELYKIRDEIMQESKMSKQQSNFHIDERVYLRFLFTYLNSMFPSEVNNEKQSDSSDEFIDLLIIQEDVKIVSIIKLKSLHNKKQAKVKLNEAIDQLEDYSYQQEKYKQQKIAIVILDGTVKGWRLLEPNGTYKKELGIKTENKPESKPMSKKNKDRRSMNNKKVESMTQKIVSNY